MLDFQDCQLTTQHISILSDSFVKCVNLHSLNLSENSLREEGALKQKFVKNLVDLIDGRIAEETREPKLNHLNLNGMALGFDAV